MHQDRPPSAGTGSAETPDRAAPRLQTMAGDPLVIEAPSPRFERRIEREAVREHLMDEARSSRDQQAPEAPKAEARADERRHVQQLRRIDELAAEHEHVSRWSGAEHAGTVVAAAIDGVIVHVGRNEHVAIPTDGASHADLVGKHVAVDRSGDIREVTPVREIESRGR
ncbi:MAG: hypothetical protein IAI50_20550 [Candidatus Eremiobacteraeota bacterium]|nr:hypothetical protein [Candidatus Eremiobacteraeota bacterium]